MLHKVIFSVQSQYSRDAFYQLFLPEDTRYIAPFEGRQEWLDAKHNRVDIEVPAKHKQLKIGFRRQAFYDGEWIAEPELIDTDLAVVLTAEGKIQQVHHSVLDTGRLTNANFLNNDVMRTAVSGLGALAGGILKLAGDAVGGLSGVPVGTIVSFFAELIWPKPSVGSLIEAAEIRMRNMILSEIHSLDRAQQLGSLGAIRDFLREYAIATTPARRKDRMQQALDAFTYVHNLLLEPTKPYTPGTAYLVLDLAGLHVSLLRERVKFEKEIFGDEPVDSAEHLRSLETTIEKYQSFLITACEKEVAHRKEQLSASYKVQLLYTVPQTRMFIRDNVRRQVRKYFADDGGFNPLTEREPPQIVAFRPLADTYYAQVENELRVRLEEDILIPSRMLSMMIPGLEHTMPLPPDRIFIVGPSSGLAEHGYNPLEMTDFTYVEDKPGLIRGAQIILHAGVANLNFEYEGADGNRYFTLREKVRGPRVAHEVSLRDGVYITRVDSWWDVFPTAVQLTFSDGTRTPLVGDAKAGVRQVATLARHGLTQFIYANNTTGFKFGFRAFPQVFF